MRGAGGISCSRRRLLASVVTSVLRYAGPVWAEALSARSRVELNRVHRLTGIRVAGAFRTVSSAAISVITGMIPVGIPGVAWLALERRLDAGRCSAGSESGKTTGTADGRIGSFPMSRDGCLVGMVRSTPVLSSFYRDMGISGSISTVYSVRRHRTAQPAWALLSPQSMSCSSVLGLKRPGQRWTQLQEEG
uniref:Putative reverse transcriptase n=1 Tax=Anopheles darlingi TaxID=43151 RepID=A0A2M4D4Z5_ANODA